MFDWIFYVALGVVAGVASALFGIGGGIIAVPVLTMMGLEPLYAIGTSTLMIFLTSLSGSAQHVRKHDVKVRSALPVALPAMVGAQAGVEIASLADARILTVAFALFVFMNLGLMQLKHLVLRAGKSSTQGHPTGWLAALRLAVIGGIAGVCSGLFGVGGGIILVPLLILLIGTSIKQAVRLSLLVVFLTSVSALVGHWLKGNVLPIEGVVLGITGVIGSRLGVRIFRKASDRRIELVFKIGLALVGVAMVVTVLKG